MLAHHPLLGHVASRRDDRQPEFGTQHIVGVGEPAASHRLDDRPVDGDVGIDNLAPRNVRRQRLQPEESLLDGGPAPREAGQSADGDTFDDLAHERHIARVVAGQRPHERAAMGFAPDQAEVDQLVEARANRWPAHAEPLGQLHLAEMSACLQAPVEDFAGQEPGDQFGGGNPGEGARRGRSRGHVAFVPAGAPGSPPAGTSGTSSPTSASQVNS